MKIEIVPVEQREVLIRLSLVEARELHNESYVAWSRLSGMTTTRRLCDALTAADVQLP